MKFEEFSKELKNKSEQINIILEEKQIEKFYKYMNLLLEWNQKMNLTAITEPNEVILKHLLGPSFQYLTSFLPIQST